MRPQCCLFYINFLWFCQWLPPDCRHHRRCLPLLPPRQKPATCTPSHSWKRRLDHLVLSILKISENSWKVSNLEILDTDSAIEGSVSSRPWNRSFKAWPNKHLAGGLSFPVFLGDDIWRWEEHTWYCQPPPPLSLICCLKLSKIAPWPSSTCNNKIEKEDRGG